MYCVKCGKEIDNDSAFCGFCGEAVPAPTVPVQAAPTAPVAESVTPPQPADESAPKAKAKKPHAEKTPVSVKKLVITCAAVLVVLALLGFGAYTYLSPENVAERFVKGMICDMESANKLLAYDGEYFYESSVGEDETFFDVASVALDADIAAWSDYYKVIKAESEMALSDEYGKYSVTTETASVKHLSVKKLKTEQTEWINTLESKIGFDGDTIDGAKSVSVNWKIKGDNTIERGTYQLTLVKTGGTWKVLTCPAWTAKLDALKKEAADIAKAEAKAAEAAKAAESAESAETADPAASAVPTDAATSAAEAPAAAAPGTATA